MHKFALLNASRVATLAAAGKVVSLFLANFFFFLPSFLLLANIT